jgi:hypothetical protein
MPNVIPMTNRQDLEVPRSPAEMKSLIVDFAEDRGAIPDTEYHRRRGVAKDIVEEYAPLQALAEHMAADCKAYLTPKSNQGSDGVIELASGESLSVQITVADQNHQTAMGRERLSEGLVTFPMSKKVRNPRTRSVEEQGRVLTTKKMRLQEQVTMIAEAVQRKNENYHDDTNILLVSANIVLNDEGLDYSWEEDLSARIARTGSSYPRIFIDTRKRCFEVNP